MTGVFRYVTYPDGYVVTMTSGEILEADFTVWVSKMARSQVLHSASSGKTLEHLEKLCIEDFVIANWALEVPTANADVRAQRARRPYG